MDKSSILRRIREVDDELYRLKMTKSSYSRRKLRDGYLRLRKSLWAYIGKFYSDDDVY